MFGLSFAPTDAQGAAGTQNGSRPVASQTGQTTVSPIQTAIRTLSLRLPNALGPTPIASALLLNSPGGAGFRGATPGSGFSAPTGTGGQGLGPLDLMQLFGLNGTSGAPAAFFGSPVTQAPSLTFGGDQPAAPTLLNPVAPAQQAQGFQNFLGTERGLRSGAPAPIGLSLGGPR